MNLLSEAANQFQIDISVTSDLNFLYQSLNLIFCLLVLMCFGDKLEESKIKEIETIQRRLLLAFSRFNILNFWPSLTKILFRKRWQEFRFLSSLYFLIFKHIVKSVYLKPKSKHSSRLQQNKSKKKINQNQLNFKERDRREQEERDERYAKGRKKGGSSEMESFDGDGDGRPNGALRMFEAEKNLR